MFLQPNAKRLVVVTGLALALGGVLTTYRLQQMDIAEVSARLSNTRAIWFLVVPVLTLLVLGVRYLRWHFLLRNAGFIIRPADSGRIFFSALPMVITPGYVGEVIKSYWLRERHGISLRSSLPLVFFERFFDVLAIGAFLIVSIWFNTWRALPALVLLSIAFGCFWYFFCPLCLRLASFLGRARLLLFLPHSPRETPPDTALLRRPYFFAVSFALSLIAWAPGVVALKIIVIALGQRMDISDSVRIFSGGTLLGGISLLPGGIAVTGNWFIRELRQSGFAISDAVFAAASLRYLTLWFTFAVGTACYLFFVWRSQKKDSLTGNQHFNEVSKHYDAQIPHHVRDLLIDRKTGYMHNLLSDSKRDKALLGLDIGCGLGWYMERMTQMGYPTVGFDLSIEQAGRASERSTHVSVADSQAIPFGDETFDFAYSINVLHHLPSREMQENAFREIARVLKPGGWFFLHEINVRNPLFRLYMGYVFPLINSIDEGTEFWIRPRELAKTDQWFAMERAEYFTFLPDFLPENLLKPVRKVESFLEKTPLRVWSAHYMVALRKR